MKGKGQNDIPERGSEHFTEVGYIGPNRTTEQSRVFAIMTMVEYRVLGGEVEDSILAVDDRSGCRIAPQWPCPGQWPNRCMCRVAGQQVVLARSTEEVFLGLHSAMTGGAHDDVQAG